MPSEGHKLLIGVFRRRWRGLIRICSQSYYTPCWLQPVSAQHIIVKRMTKLKSFSLSNTKDSRELLGRSWSKVNLWSANLSTLNRRRVDTYICRMKKVTSLRLELLLALWMIWNSWIIGSKLVLNKFYMASIILLKGIIEVKFCLK